MKMETTNLLRFLSGETIFNILNYQPAYAWSAEQCKQLFFDLEHNWKNKTTTDLGMIVYTEEVTQSIYTYNIIDHRQIVINCMLLLKALADVYPNLKDEIEHRYLYNPYLKDLKLNPITQYKTDFHLIMTDQMDKAAETSQLMNTFNHYKTLIRDTDIKMQRKLYEALNTFNVIVINVNPQENESPQSLLDAINLTSYNLNDADKVLTFILKHAKENEKEYLHRDYWLKIKELISNRYPSMMDFLRDYLELKSGNSIDKYKLYSTYHYYYKVNNLTPKTALEDLYHIALNNDVSVEEKAKRKYEHKDHSDNVLSPDEHYITEDIDVTNYDITQLNIDGNKIKVNYWKQALVKFLNFLFEMDKSNRKLIMKNKRLNKTIFKTYDDDRTCCLDNGELVYAHLSANDSLRRIREVSKACHMTDVVTFKVIPKDKR